MPIRRPYVRNSTTGFPEELPVSDVLPGIKSVILNIPTPSYSVATINVVDANVTSGSFILAQFGSSSELAVNGPEDIADFKLSCQAKTGSIDFKVSCTPRS